MTSDPHRFGRAAEVAAEEHLCRKGYRILDRNVRYPNGELDIVARDRETVVFVEVKARRSHEFGGASYAVTRQKERRLIQLAAQYVGQHHLQDCPCRFDVILLQGGAQSSCTLDHIENAFEVAGNDLRW